VVDNANSISRVTLVMVFSLKSEVIALPSMTCGKTNLSDIIELVTHAY
jgi:hypothetical protein